MTPPLENGTNRSPVESDDTPHTVQNRLSSIAWAWRHSTVVCVTHVTDLDPFSRNLLREEYIEEFLQNGSQSVTKPVGVRHNATPTPL